MQTPRNNADPAGGDFLSARPNRRWSVRQKIHTPAYISINPCEDGTIFGLNEVFDIGTGGLSFQSPEPLVPGSRVRMNLELSGAGEPVRATGRVIWSDLTGRTGVQLRRSSLSAPRRLDEYLFLNAITACSHYHALQSRASESPEQLPTLGDLPWNSKEGNAEAERTGYPELLACLSEIKTEMDTAGLSRDLLLQKLAEQALAFLHASGVAIAIAGEDEIVCQACAGSAPGVGTRFQAGTGFSGECIRSGVLLHCDDAETDPRVDHGACLALGIRSILAAPIRSGIRTAGLIEVFSGQPDAFNRNSRIFLQRLAEIIAAILSNGASVRDALNSEAPDVLEGRRRPISETRLAEASVRETNAHQSWMHESDLASLLASPGTASDFFSPQLRRMLLLGSAAVILIGATALMPWIRIKAGHATESDPEVQPASVHRDAPKSSASAAPATQLKHLRQLAEAGDDNAQFALGARYATGDGVAQDYASAARWFSRAADQGHVVAQATLGAYYWAGRGVPADLQRAYFWSVLAQAGGDEGSKFRLASLASSMSHDEVVMAAGRGQRVDSATSAGKAGGRQSSHP